MSTSAAATRLSIFLTEDDRAGHHSLAEALLESARSAGLAGVTMWRAVEGFGSSGVVRAARLPDLGRGLPLVVEVIDEEGRIADFLAVVAKLAPGSLVTTEMVQVTRTT